MTRFGMGIAEMEHIAELIKECIIDRKPVKEEVNRFRSEYKRVKYRYHEPKPKQLKVLEDKQLKN
jgi:glycine/serine hydroxymethyltransferase